MVESRISRQHKFRNYMLVQTYGAGESPRVLTRNARIVMYTTDELEEEDDDDDDISGFRQSLFIFVRLKVCDC